MMRLSTSSSPSTTSRVSCHLHQIPSDGRYSGGDLSHPQDSDGIILLSTIVSVTKPTVSPFLVNSHLSLTLTRCSYMIKKPRGEKEVEVVLQSFNRLT